MVKTSIDYLPEFVLRLTPEELDQLIELIHSIGGEVADGWYQTLIELRNAAQA